MRIYLSLKCPVLRILQQYLLFIIFVDQNHDLIQHDLELLGKDSRLVTALLSLQILLRLLKLPRFHDLN